MGDDPDLIEEFLQDYAITLQEAVDEMQRHVASCHWRGVAALAHKLKSSSSSVGALALGLCCEALEQAGLQQDVAAVQRALTTFDALCPRVLKALGQDVADREHLP